MGVLERTNGSGLTVQDDGRRYLSSIMQRYHFPGKLIRLLQATMNGVQCKVRVSNLTSKSFESHRGLRQGDGLSCLLFNIVLENVVRGAGLDNDIAQGNRTYCRIHRLLRSRRLRAHTKCEIYRSLIRSVVLYLYESWTIRAENAKALGVSILRILRIIADPFGSFGTVRRTEHPGSGEG